MHNIFKHGQLRFMHNIFKYNQLRYTCVPQPLSEVLKTAPRRDFVVTCKQVASASRRLYYSKDKRFPSIVTRLHAFGTKPSSVQNRLECFQTICKSQSPEKNLNGWTNMYRIFYILGFGICSLLPFLSSVASNQYLVAVSPPLGYQFIVMCARILILGKQSTFFCKKNTFCKNGQSSISGPGLTSFGISPSALHIIYLSLPFPSHLIH